MITIKITNKIQTRLVCQRLTHIWASISIRSRTRLLPLSHTSRSSCSLIRRMLQQSRFSRHINIWLLALFNVRQFKGIKQAPPKFRMYIVGLRRSSFVLSCILSYIMLYMSCRTYTGHLSVFNSQRLAITLYSLKAK